MISLASVASSVKWNSMEMMAVRTPAIMPVSAPEMVPSCLPASVLQLKGKELI